MAVPVLLVPWNHPVKKLLPNEKYFTLTKQALCCISNITLRRVRVTIVAVEK
jgi:hypothetical protein